MIYRPPRSSKGNFIEDFSGLLILQYCIGIGSIANTFLSIGTILQYFLKFDIGIGIANNYF